MDKTGEKNNDNRLNNKQKSGYSIFNSMSFEISISKIIIGIIIGLLFSFVFYSFLFVNREMFRILSANYSYKLWILTENEVNFYNLIFAFISVIFGQSVCFVFWFDGPKKLFKRHKFRKNSILNDQRVLMWYFLNWFVRTGTSFAVVFIITFYGGFEVFSFYPDYNYVFVLIIIVLFLQSWNNIRISFKRQSLKWMLFSALIITGVSFGFSKVDIVNYHRINKILQQNKISYKYNLTLPESNTYQFNERFSQLVNIYVVKPKKHNNSDDFITLINKKEVSPDSIYNELEKLNGEKNHMYRRLTIYQLYIDKGIKTGVVNNLKFQISRLGLSRIAYSVVPVNRDFNQAYYNNLSILTKLPGIDSSRLNIYEFISQLNRLNKEFEIVQLNNGDCLIDNSLVKIDSIQSAVFDIMIKNSDFYFKFYPNDSVDFQKYISVISQIRMASNEIRDYYSLNLFSKKFADLYGDEWETVERKYPLRIIEFTDDLIRFLNDNEKNTHKDQ